MNSRLYLLVLSLLTMACGIVFRWRENASAKILSNELWDTGNSSAGAALDTAPARITPVPRTLSVNQPNKTDHIAVTSVKGKLPANVRDPFGVGFRTELLVNENFRMTYLAAYKSTLRSYYSGYLYSMNASEEQISEFESVMLKWKTEYYRPRVAAQNDKNITNVEIKAADQAALAVRDDELTKIFGLMANGSLAYFERLHVEREMVNEISILSYAMGHPFTQPQKYELAKFLNTTILRRDTRGEWLYPSDDEYQSFIHQLNRVSSPPQAEMIQDVLQKMMEAGKMSRQK